MFQNLNFLIKTIRINKKKNPQVSYTANIFKKGKWYIAIVNLFVL